MSPWFALFSLMAVRVCFAADVYINIAGQGGEQRIALGLAPFIAESRGAAEQALAVRKIQEVARADLLFSRYFVLLEQGPAFTGGNVKEIAQGWKTQGAQWLLTAQSDSTTAQRISLLVRLTNLASGESALERYYRQDASYLRSCAHRIADDVVQTLTGRDGIAHTQIAFANNRTGHKEIYVMDYDGENLRQITNDRSIGLLPRFAPGAKLLAYTSYKAGNPDLYVYDFEQRRARVLSSEQGLNIPGAFSPDGSQLLLTLSLQKDPNLFVKNLADGTLARLTQHFGVDSSPTFSPDASQVAFASDRSGNPLIYVLAVATQKAKRLTHAMNWCDSPAWSPGGEWIAFSGRLQPKDKMDIYLVDVTGNQVRRLTHGEGSNENPAWSPDGRFIAFTSTRGGRTELYVMDSDGSAPHKLAEIPGATFTPAWSN